MGLTHTLVKLRNLSSANGTYEADFLVDIGATDSLVPVQNFAELVCSL